MSNLISYVVLVAAFVTVASYASVPDAAHEVDAGTPAATEG